MIGKGGFGEVYLAQICPGGRTPFEAAVKIPHTNDNNDLKQEALICEFNFVSPLYTLQSQPLATRQHPAFNGAYCRRSKSKQGPRPRVLLGRPVEHVAQEEPVRVDSA